MSFLKSVTLFSTLSFVSIAFPSAPPAQQTVDPFEAKLAAIDAMAEVDTLCEPLPLSRDEAEQRLMQNKACLANIKQEIPKLFDADMQARRLAHKYWTTCKEIETCNNHGRKQQLTNKKQEFHAQAQNADNVLVQEATTLLNEGGNSTIYAYNYRRYQASALANQLLLERIDVEKEKVRLQQENQALKAQLRGYQLLVDGPPQREGVPNVPGGPQPQEGIQKKKRSSSCER